MVIATTFETRYAISMPQRHKDVKPNILFLFELCDDLLVGRREIGEQIGLKRQAVSRLGYHGFSLQVVMFPKLRELAKLAGWSDKVLLDKICRDANWLKKNGVKAIIPRPNRPKKNKPKVV